MRNRKTTVFFLTMIVLLASMAGCGGTDSVTAPKVENFTEPTSEEAELPAAGQSEEKEAPNEGEAGHETDPKDRKENDPEDMPAKNAAKEEAYLRGNVKSIGSDSIVVSQAFTEGDNIMSIPVDGSSDEVLVTVNVSENTQYEVKTVKNGGVSEETDVDVRYGNISDLKEESFVEISGYYDEELFWAEQITISVFV